MADNVNARKKALSSLFGESAPAQAEAPKKFTLDSPSQEENPTEDADVRQETASRRSRRKTATPEDGRKPARIASIAYLEEEVYWKLKAISAASGVSVSELTSQALQKAIAWYEKENGEVSVGGAVKSRQSKRLF